MQDVQAEADARVARVRQSVMEHAARWADAEADERLRLFEVMDVLRGAYSDMKEGCTLHECLGWMRSQHASDAARAAADVLDGICAR
jgi:hypothetical protein